MPSTERGLIYPDSTGHTRLWEHLQALADSAEAALDAVDARERFAKFDGPQRRTANDITVGALEAIRWTSVVEAAAWLTHDATLNGTARFTFQQSGVYRVHAKLHLASAAATVVQSGQIDGAGGLLAVNSVACSAANGSGLPVELPAQRFNAGDWFTFSASRSTAAGVFSVAAGFHTLCVTRIGDLA